MANNLTAVITADVSGFKKNIESAKTLLNQYANASKTAANEINKNVGVTNEQVNAYQRVIKSLEKVNSGSMSTTQQQKALAAQIKELKVQWIGLSNEAKSSNFGKSISDSCKAAQSQLHNLNEQIRHIEMPKEMGGGNSLGLDSIKNVFQSIKNLDINGMTNSFKEMGNVDMSMLKGSFSGLGGELGALAVPAATAATAIAAIGTVCVAAREQVNLFNGSIRDMKQKLGDKVDLQQIEEIKEFAIELSSVSTQTSEETVSHFKKIGSAIPEFTKNQGAFEEVVSQCQNLEDALNLGQDSAINAITVAMTQFGVGSGQANQFINAFAEASQNTKMSAEDLSKAFGDSAMSAQRLGISYQDSLSALAIASNEFPNAEAAGSAYNQMLTKMAQSTNDDFNPAVVGLQKALENASNANLDAKDKQELFGKSGQLAAQALMGQTQKLEELKVKLNESNKANELAAENNDTTSAKAQMLENSWNNLLTTIGQNETFKTLESLIKDIIDGCSSLIQDFIDIVSQTNNVTGGFSGLNVIMNTLKAIWVAIYTPIKAVILLLKGAIAIINSIISYVTTLGRQLVTSLSQTKLFQTLTNWCSKVYNWFKEIIGVVSKLIGKYNEWTKSVGKTKLSSKTQNIKVKQHVVTQTEAPDGKGGKGGKGDGKTKSTSTKNNTPKFAKNSLEDYEHQLSELQNKYKNGLIKLDKDKYLKQVEELKDKIEAKKIQLGLEPSLDSISGIQKKISDLQAKLNLSTSYSDRQKIQADIDKWTKKKNIIEFALKYDSKKYDELINKQEPKKKASDEFKTEEETYGNANIEKNNKKISENNTEIDRLHNSVEELQKAYEELGKAIENASKQGIDVSKMVKDHEKLGNTLNDVKKKEDNLRKENKNLTKSNKDLSKQTKKQQEEQEKLNATSEAFGEVGDTFNQLGNAIGGTTGQVINMFGTFANGISELIPQIMALTTAKEGEAVASGTAEAAKAPWPIQIAQISAVVGTIIGIFASIAGSFADGGIIGGNTSLGDFNLARVNSGEMILNGTQQSRLFSLLNSGGVGVADSMSNGNVNFIIKGNNLVGTLKNHISKTNRI